MTIFVGNLRWSITEEELSQLFERYGSVASVRLAIDRETGRARGFGFVEMPDADEAQAAIMGLHGCAVEGRLLTVNEARPRAGDTRPRRSRW
jgi:RNA recognition motif-containing protein